MAKIPPGGTFNFQEWLEILKLPCASKDFSKHVCVYSSPALSEWNEHFPLAWPGSGIAAIIHEATA